MLASACGSVKEVVILDKPAPRVSLKGFALDLAFGKAPVEPLEASGEKPLTEIAEEVFFFEDEFITPRPVKPIDGGPPDPCPEPGPNVFAREPITIDVKAPVKDGVYLYHQDGTIEFVGLTKTTVKGITSRIISNLVVDADGSFTYDYELVVGTQRQTWGIEVIPGQGIYITSMVRRISGGTETFNPIPPVQIMPLPVSENTTVTGAGVDPLSAESMVVQGLVTSKQRILGCDEVADGWYVEGTWTLRRGTRATPIQVEYAIATQHGGLIIFDRLRFTQTEGPLTVNYDLATAFGKIDPRPPK